MSQLVEDINRAECGRPTLWWLGQSGFVVKHGEIIFYIDPCPDIAAAPIDHADLILCTHHLDGPALSAILEASTPAKVVLPKSRAEHARAIGIPYERMTTTDSHLRVEYFKGGQYGRVYAVPSAHNGLEWTPLGGYPYLGYLIRFGETTIYHAGDSVPYDGLVEELRPFNVTLAILPIGARNFPVAEAAELASRIGARWLAPMRCGDLDPADDSINRFIEHMLGHRPEQRFKVFERGKGWAIPEE